MLHLKSIEKRGKHHTHPQSLPFRIWGWDGMGLRVRMEHAQRTASWKEKRTLHHSFDDERRFANIKLLLDR